MGVSTEHSQKFEKLAQQIGVRIIRQHIPYSAAELAAALAKDENLNTIPLQRWDNAHVSLLSHVHSAGIRSWSLSDTVCVLKHVAREHVIKAGV